MIHRAKKEGFGHLLESGLLDWLDIAYCASTKCLPTFGNVTRSWRIIQRSQKCIFEWSKELKKRFCAIFCSSVCWICLILPELVWIKKEVWEFLKVKEVKDVRNCWFSRGTVQSRHCIFNFRSGTIIFAWLALIKDIKGFSMWHLKKIYWCLYTQFWLC